MISQKSSPDSTLVGHALSNDMACRLLDDGSADVQVITLCTLPSSTLNSTGGHTPPLKTLITFLPPTIPAGIPTSAITPDYSYNGREHADTFSTKNTMNRPDVAWKQQPEEGMVL
jgi:hypothetical protein